MNLLSIHDGHTATVCFMQDGRLMALVSEERFTNIKNQSGFPRLSLQWILSEYRITMAEMDAVVFPHLVQPINFAKTFAGHYSHRHLLAYFLNFLVPRKILAAPHMVTPYIKLFRRYRLKIIRSHCSTYGIARDQVHQLEHHTAHRYAALYGSGFTKREAPVLIFTLDGSGDGLSNTVARWDPRRGHELLSRQSSYHSLGELYSLVTQLLGMRPGEHEYKIMGMAPYVPAQHSERAYDMFRRYIHLNESGEIINTARFGTAMLARLRRDFRGERFDNICSAIQLHFERIVLNWVGYWQAKTNIRSAVFGGGCFMNSKANMLISDLPGLDKAFFLPSCGDESTALGGVYHLAEALGERNPDHLSELYKGPAYGIEDVARALGEYSGQIVYRRVKNIDDLVARILAKGGIVGRFEGRSEWGARALGNRSILCRADNASSVRNLNKAIKMRDFWMPFAASILAEDADRYLCGATDTNGPYMTQTFRTKPLARQHLIAGLHPYDHTCRAQIVTKDASPAYHRLLSEFKRLTDIGGILNTSFNLHGAPIVGTPRVALETLLNSDLDYVALSGFLVRKRNQTGLLL
jgi:carbamoyltransferase